MEFSDTYVQLLKQGPFPGQIDPWAENARYFQSIHSGMIDHLLSQIQDPLLKRGYLVGKETSLQIVEGREPDLYVRGNIETLPQEMIWDYVMAATAVAAEPGLIAETRDLQALHISDSRAGDLVTIVEIVSPGNKTQDLVIEEYQERRGRLLLRQGVNVVEIDATRSNKRLLQHYLTAAHAYHIAVYLPHQWPRVVYSNFGQPLKRIALPLRAEVIAVELQKAYDHAYQMAATAGHIRKEKQYTLEGLPFPSLLTDEQRQSALQAVDAWQKQLAELEHS